MKQHFVSNGVKLCGVLSNPKETTDVPVVVLCHGFSSSKTCSTHEVLVPLLNDAGITTFAFDFHGHGESEGDFADITPSLGVQNARDAIVFLKEKGFSKIGLYGGSYGGYVGYGVAAKEELFAVVAKCPVADFGELLPFMGGMSVEEWKAQGYGFYSEPGIKKRLNYSFAEDALNHPAYDFAKEVEVPTLIIHGDADTTVPLDQSRKMAELIPHCMLAVVDGADHMFSGDTFDTMIQLASNFLLEQVKP